MTIKDFYKVCKENNTIEIQKKNNEHLFNPIFYSWAEMAETIDFNIEIKRIKLNFSPYSPDFRGFIFYVDEKDYNMIYNIYNKQRKGK